MKDSIKFYIRSFITEFCTLSWVAAALCALISGVVFMLTNTIIFWWIFVPVEVMNIGRAIYVVATTKKASYK